MFGELGHDLPVLSVHDDIGQDGVGCDVVVPDVVVNQLVMPDPLAGLGLHGHQRR